jgi:hypothetical protein
MRAHFCARPARPVRITSRAIADSHIVLSPPPTTAVERTPPVAAARRPPLVVWVVLAALLVGVLAFGASTLMRAPGRNMTLDGWLYSSLTISAAALVAARAWRIADERWAWGLISTGMACFALGDVVYAVWGAFWPVAVGGGSPLFGAVPLRLCRIVVVVTDAVAMRAGSGSA